VFVERDCAASVAAAIAARAAATGRRMALIGWQYCRTPAE